MNIRNTAGYWAGVEEVQEDTRRAKARDGARPKKKELEARIEAALDIYENAPYDPRLERAEAMAQALRGKKP